MPIVRLSKDVDYVTMINYFSVAPEDKQEFAEMEVKEIDKYGDNMDSALAASFHRSMEGSRVFNYAHWKSKKALEASQQTSEFKAHIKRMSHLDFTPDPRVYQVVHIYGAEEPVINSESSIVPILTMIYAKSGSQQQIIDILMRNNLARSPDIASSHLLRSEDGQRVAIYTQCRDRSTAESWKKSFSKIAELADNIETLPYELLGSYN